MRSIFVLFLTLFLAALPDFGQPAGSPNVKPGENGAGMQLPGLLQTAGSLKGTVTDDSGAVIPGANVTVSGNGVKKTVSTNEKGAFSVAGLPDGIYTLRVNVTGFTPYENRNVALVGGQTVSIAILMKLPAQKQEVTVQGEQTATVSVEPSQNVGQLILRQAEIDALPDDPDDLAADLQALAGPSAGPSGGQIYIDGFTGGRLPPKESIREIRINQNPFSSEYDKVGFGRIEILTKPGTDKFRGQVFFSDSDSVFNSRNPYSTNKPDYFSRQYGGNVSGPISKRASFFFDFERRDIDDNAVIAATILRPDLSIGSLNEAVLVPNRRTVFSPRIDYQLTPNNTLVARYSFLRSSEENAGVGVFDLVPSPATNIASNRAASTTNNEDSIQITETAVLGAKVVNETHFRVARDVTSDVADSAAPALLVSQAFNGGGSQVGDTYQNDNNFEVQNYTTITSGLHTFKFGARVRTDNLESVSPNNFGGTFLYSTGEGPELDANNMPVLDSSGNPVEITLTSLERYQRTQVLQNLGYTAAQIVALGGGPSQFSIATGNPKASVSQTDLGAFFQDDWRVKTNLTVSLGLRYEWQNNIRDHKDWAPRLSVAWSPDSKGGKNGKTVLRAGSGLFYDRFSDSLVLNSIRFNGINQQQYIVQNPDFLSIPAIGSLGALPQTIYQIDPSLRTPYIIQTAVGVERQLPAKTVAALNFIDSHGMHELLTRNIDAPLPGTFVPGTLNPGLGIMGTQRYGPGNIYQYESAGIFNQTQLMLNVRTQATQSISFFGYYVYGHAHSNTDGVGTFPANQYDLSQDYGRSSLDQRHRVVLVGSYTSRWGVRWSPFFIAHTGTPFNITTGRDTYGNSVYTERPAFAASCTGPDVVCNSYGMFNLNPAEGATLIPRNYGNGPAYVTINLRVSKTWGFGKKGTAQYNPADSTGGRHSGSGFGGGYGGSHSSHGSGGSHSHGSSSDSLTDQRFNLTLSASARNLLNTVNQGTPIGNLGSPLFGLSNQIAAGFGPTGQSANNRRIELLLRFSF
jgi:hypothetical protein